MNSCRLEQNKIKHSFGWLISLALICHTDVVLGNLPSTSACYHCVRSVAFSMLAPSIIDATQPYALHRGLGAICGWRVVLRTSCTILLVPWPGDLSRPAHRPPLTQQNHSLVSIQQAQKFDPQKFLFKLCKHYCLCICYNL
jgi:hypothetical protein